MLCILDNYMHKFELVARTHLTFFLARTDLTFSWQELRPRLQGTKRKPKQKRCPPRLSPDFVLICACACSCFLSHVHVSY